jgi:hypothetical protein
VAGSIKSEGKGSSNDDLLLQLVARVENLTKEEAFHDVRQLLDYVDFSYFQLGGALTVIQEREWWVGEGQVNFRDFVEGYFGLHYRKAMYLIHIYKSLANSGVSWQAVVNVGWTKLKEMAAILTPENVGEWVQKAKTMTTLQLQEAVAAYKTQLGAGGVAVSDPVPSDITTITFRVHPDQKETIKQAIGRARKEMETEYDAVALEALCLNYLAGGKVSAPKNLKQVFASTTPTVVVTTFNEVWPDIPLKLDVP